MGETVANIRRRALMEALDWLEFRVEVCRKTEEEWGEKHGADSRGCATERAARHELEQAIEQIARIGVTPRNSRKLKQEAAERAAFVRECQTARHQAKQESPDADR